MARPDPEFYKLLRHPALPAAPLWRGMRIGLLGGSFNPAHDGHLFISLLALRRLKLDEVWWLVSPQNPLKSKADLAAMQARIRRARQIARHPRIRVLALEGRMGTRYTADTLLRLNALLSHSKFIWLMGADAFLDMPRWQEWTRIFSLAPVAVFGRPSYSLRVTAAKAALRFAARRIGEAQAGSIFEKQLPAWVFFRSTRHPASSTLIRQEYAARGRRWED